MSGYRVSSFMATWINLITLVASLGILSFGVWLATKGDCERFFMTPVLIIGAVAFAISFIGFIGAWKDNVCLLWTYLAALFLLIVSVSAFTGFAFAVTNKGASHVVSGQRFKEYRLGDYSHWLQNQVNDPKKWRYFRSCFVQTHFCDQLSRKYRTVKNMKAANLNSIESGCCMPPAECGFAMKNSSFFDLTSRPRNSNKDCKTFKNDSAIKCYSCSSCKAGVAEYLKRKWHRMSTFNIVLFVVLIVIYSIGCCARRSATRWHQYSKV